jgi:hypothetical protein
LTKLKVLVLKLYLALHHVEVNSFDLRRLYQCENGVINEWFNWPFEVVIIEILVQEGNTECLAAEIGINVSRIHAVLLALGQLDRDVSECVRVVVTLE